MDRDKLHNFDKYQTHQKHALQIAQEPSQFPAELPNQIGSVLVILRGYQNLTVSPNDKSHFASSPVLLSKISRSLAGPSR